MPRSRARALPLFPLLLETWIVTIKQLRLWITPQGVPPYRPYLILVASVDTGAVRGSEIVRNQPTPRNVWRAVAQAIERPAPMSGGSGVPRAIITPDHALAESLRPLIADAGLEIKLAVQPLPVEMIDLLRDFENHMQPQKAELPGLLSASGVTVEIVRDLFAAAAEFYRVAPWLQLDNDQVIALRHPAEKEYRFATVMGNAGVEYGIVMNRFWSDVLNLFKEDEHPMEMTPAGGWCSITFDDAVIVPFDDLDAIEKFGFEIAAPTAYPVPLVVESKDKARRPSRDDLLWYQAAMRAIPQLVRDHLKPNGRGDYEPFETTVPVVTHAGTIQVAVKYPAGELPMGEQPAQRFDWSEPEDESSERPPFDRRRMERTMQEIAETSGEERGDSELARAQDLMWEAFDEVNPAKRIALAHDALALSPDCADAYVLLAEELADTVQRSLEYYQQGVAAGERALGKKLFKEAAGQFWGILETRPYMRARAGLAQALWRLNRKEEALAHYREMLRLNPNDNQGIRYLLVDLLLQMEQDDEVTPLLEQYPRDWSAVWQYTRALLEFRRHAASARANRWLIKAFEQNPHVPAYLTGRKRIPKHLPDYIGMGDELEAVAYAADHLNHWRRTPGAVEWLLEGARGHPVPPRKKKPRKSL